MTSRPTSSFGRLPCRRHSVSMIIILLVSYGPESCARYLLVEESHPTRNKRCGRQRRRYDEFMRKLQKKICEKIYNLMKMRLGVKEFNIESPCND